MEYQGKHLHVLAFDIPVPINYGGAIDIYYKLKSLHSLGVRIHLHCFQYGRKPAEELNEYCESVHYYERRRNPFLLLGSKPFIVSSRYSEPLIQELLEDDYPILFEGLHTTACLDDGRLRNRQRIVRTHNIEHHYYKGLADAESNIARRIYFRSEGRKLLRWEKILAKSDGLATISFNDEAHFRDIVGRVVMVSAFHPDMRVSSEPGNGDFVLYHGSLDVSENQRAAKWLVEYVFNGLDIPLVIAGNKPSAALRASIRANPSAKLVEGLNADQIRELLSKAHINVLPTFQATGIKLKLLAALFRGRHCVVNSPMVQNTGLEGLCHVVEEAQDFRNTITDLMGKPFDQSEIEKRRQILDKGFYSNEFNANRLLELIYGSEDS